MINIQGPGSLKKMYGLSNGEVHKIPDLRFARKHLTNPKEDKFIKSTRNIFSFVSSPLIYKDKRVIKHSRGWCHALKNPDQFLPKDKPKIFLPESDFMDPMFISSIPKQSKKYDFFYYTLNAKAGIVNKGLDVFCNCLDTLCGQMKLKGLVIVYFPNVPRIKRFTYLNIEQNRKINQYSSNLDFFWGKMNDKQMAEVASKVRFGFFPNTADNSPRTISETLIRDTPILVNENIHGGWHYINDRTGQLFNMNNLKEKTTLMIEKKYNSREHFCSNYGFKKSSQKLAEFVQSIVRLDREYTHMYFNNYRNYLSKCLLNSV